MSNYVGNSETCKHCGITYKDFRSGFTYREVYVMLMDYSEDNADWKYKRRNTILGKWHQMKKEAWAHHRDDGECLSDPRNMECRSEAAE